MKNEEGKGRKRGRPHKVKPADRVSVFLDFNELLRQQPDIKFTDAHRIVGEKWGVGEMTVRAIVADFESMMAGTDPEVIPPPVGVNPKLDAGLQFLRDNVQDPRLRPPPQPADETERAKRARVFRAWVRDVRPTLSKYFLVVKPLIEDLRKRQPELAEEEARQIVEEFVKTNKWVENKDKSGFAPDDPGLDARLRKRQDRKRC